MESDIAVLNGIALDLRWAWNHAADQLWEYLEPELWRLTSNAWIVLQTVSRDKLERAFSDPAFRKLFEDVRREREEAYAGAPWFERRWPHSGLTSVAYFSLEFMLDEALPIYSGGLGNVAGDQLKAASDLGVPVIGVGLLYYAGYFRQIIDAAGNQIALRPYNDPGQMPVTPVRDKQGGWLRIRIALPGSDLWIRTWRVQAGRTVLYLLDTNDPANLPEHRGITSELYGGGPELRLEQERVLGVGGWRMVRALGLNPEVCHMNEGHAAFVILERARDYMKENGCSFEVALAATRVGNVFTTHTPVAAGFDRFAPDLMSRSLRRYSETELGISFNDLLALGRANPADAGEPFNMAYLAVRGSGAVNGVSRLHGEVSRAIFQPLFPRWPQVEVPVKHVTNGVHTPTWDSQASDELWTVACGKSRWRESTDNVEPALRNVPAADLWRMRNCDRRALIGFVRSHLSRQLAGSDAPKSHIEMAGQILDPDTLTLGFARRFAAYKRPDLLLRNPDRLLRILGNSQRPVQLILAGKAHPQDQEGQALIRRWIEFIRGAAARSHAVFLSDYDMRLALHLTQGVDLWLNTPRRPWEASGTSGMKVLVNGGLNFSELDGWWAEAYSNGVGWAIGDGKEHGADPAWDDAEAERLYDLLEHQIVPAFYDRDQSGVPVAWVNRMRESMAKLTPAFSANRTVREYTENHYLPAARNWTQRAANEGRLAAEIVAWRNQVEQHWPALRFGALDVQSDGGRRRFTVQVFLNELNPDFISVELFADAAPGHDLFRKPMQRGPLLTGAANAFSYSLAVPADRPASDFTPRIVPFHPAALSPLECARILWRS